MKANSLFLLKWEHAQSYLKWSLQDVLHTTGNFFCIILEGYHALVSNTCAPSILFISYGLYSFRSYFQLLQNLNLIKIKVWINACIVFNQLICKELPRMQKYFKSYVVLCWSNLQSKKFFQLCMVSYLI